MIRPCPWKPRTICIEIHFDWVLAEAHQLEDLFMEPWVEATSIARELGAQESGMEFPPVATLTDHAASSNNSLLTMFCTKFGFLADRNLVVCIFRLQEVVKW
uniref:Uncharacterized protein n=1 Tax=Fagus sylvatica TaxID=28930 RepID=A0A2N9HU14_FAGSY